AHVEPVADDEVVGDGEPHVAQVGIDLLEAFAQQQGADLEAGRAAGREVLAQVVEGEPGVDDVLDEEDVAARQVDVEVLHDAHDAAGLGGGAVRRHGHEVELDGQVDLAGQVGHEHERTLEQIGRAHVWNSSHVKNS